MDERIPRAKMPRTALPPELRKKMGFKPRSNEEKENNIYKPGSGVLQAVGSGKDGSFLKKHSSVPMSHRTSGYARMHAMHTGARAVIPRARAIENGAVIGEK